MREPIGRHSLPQRRDGRKPAPPPSTAATRTSSPSGRLVSDTRATREMLVKHSLFAHCLSHQIEASFEAAVHHASALRRGGRSRNAVGADRRWWKRCASYLYACPLPGCRDRRVMTRPGLGGRLGLVAGLALGRDQYCTGWSSSERGALMAWSIRSATLASASLGLAI
jgi:hypothetical protein